MITIKVDADKLLAELSDKGKRQVPYALSVGLNNIALDAQQSMRLRLRRVFTLRRPTFIERLVKIEKFAKKGDPSTRFGIAGPRADLLTKFEAGGPKPVRSSSVALPVGAGRTKSGIISTFKRPRVLLASRAAKRVFVVQTKSGNRLILQRTGKRKGGKVKALFALIPKQKVHIPATLEFERTVAGVIRGRALRHLQAAFAKAMSTAR